MAATRNQFNEKQLIPYMWHSNPTSLHMLRPCIALPQRAAHALGSSTGRRSSLDGRRSWGRGRGRPVCRSSGIRTWGTLFSCLRPFTMLRIRFILLILADTVPVATAIQPTRAPAPGSPPACLDRRRTLPPRFRGAAELKFAPSKCRPPPQFVHIDENDPRLNNAGWNGRGRVQNKPRMPGGFHQTR